ncbi:MAG: inositol monophosphatase family protein [Pirellulaceae bacterium]
MSDSIMTVAEVAARAGGDVLRDWEGRVQAREKAPHDLVTEADLAAQQRIEEVIHETFPDHDFLGEEGNATWPRRSSYRWIVDPLDGTTNYVHGLHQYCVSIAVEHDDQLIAGVVFDPKADECFTAFRGAGAKLNGVPIRTSRCELVDKALMAASFSAQVARDSIEIRRFVEVLLKCQALRRLGSAALNLCYLAAGRLDGYWATSVKSWDIAAGAVIVREAGGTVTNVDGRPLDLNHPTLLAASSEKLHRELLRSLRQANS